MTLRKFHQSIEKAFVFVVDIVQSVGDEGWCTDGGSQEFDAVYTAFQG